MPTTTTDSVPTRASLLGRAQNPADDAAWNEFDDLYRRLVLAVARRRGLTPAQASEVAQDCMVSVASALPAFEYAPESCRFRTWLLGIAERRIADHFRRQAAERQLQPLAGVTRSGGRGVETVVDPAPPTLEAVWQQEWEGAVLELAWARLKRQVKPLAYQVLYLRLREEHTYTAIARALGISLNRVYLAKLRAGRVFERLLREAKHEVELWEARVIPRRLGRAGTNDFHRPDAKEGGGMES